MEIISVSSVNPPSFLVLKPHFQGFWVDWLQLRPTWHPPWSKRKKLVLGLLDMLHLPEAQGNLPPENLKMRKCLFTRFFFIASDWNLKWWNCLPTWRFHSLFSFFALLGNGYLISFTLPEKKEQESLVWSYVKNMGRVQTFKEALMMFNNIPLIASFPS